LTDYKDKILGESIFYRISTWISFLGIIIMFLGIYLMISENKNLHDQQRLEVERVAKEELAQERVDDTSFKAKENADLSSKLELCQQDRDEYNELLHSETETSRDFVKLVRKEISMKRRSALGEMVPIIVAVKPLIKTINSFPSQKYKYRFRIWLDIDEGRAKEIKEVVYRFYQHPDRIGDRVTKRVGTGFSVKVAADGCMSNVLITIRSISGKSYTISFNTCEALNWNKDEKGIESKQIALYYVSSSNRSYIRRIRRNLQQYKELGYSLTVHRLKEHDSDYNIRCFSRKDMNIARELASNVADVLREIGFNEEVTVDNIGMKHKNQSNGRFEIWIPEIRQRNEGKQNGRNF